jgi:DNA-binding beta-propeller fold protein YncE
MPSAAEDPPVFQLRWGTTGSGNGQFIHPFGVGVSADGSNIYVCDGGNARVQVFSPAGAYLGQWTTGAAPFGQPTDVTPLPSGAVYVTDPIGCSAVVLSSGGVYQSTVGGCGLGDGLYGSPYALAVAQNGDVYVLDVAVHSITQYAAGTGAFVRKIGGFGTGNGQFMGAIDIVISPDQQLYALDAVLCRVQKFLLDGTYNGNWGAPGSSLSAFANPQAMAVDGSGNIYVADTDNHRIQKFAGDGSFIVAWGEDGTGDGNTRAPNGIAVDADGNVYVSDSTLNRVTKFGPSTAVEPTTWGAIKSLYSR